MTEIGHSPSPALTPYPSIPPKTVGTAYKFALWLGGFGAHRFYLGKIGTGILWLLTGGLFGIGLIVDSFTLNGQVAEANAKLGIATTSDVPGALRIGTAYKWFWWLGVFGAHRFYQGKVGTGILWLLTGGLFGIGLIVDSFTLNGQIIQRNVERGFSTAQL